MKELSIEEKAKAYDEAIEKLRSLHDDYDTVSTLIDVKEELENIFPVLKESEDEKIRKELVQFFKEKDEEDFKEWIPKAKVLAWLEKQGENSMCKVKIGETYKCIASPRYTCFSKGDIYHVEDNFVAELINTCSDCFVLLEKQSEQKHVDKVESSTFKDKLLELFQKFRYIKEDVITNGDIIDYVDAHIQELIDTVQNKPWSEEDESNLDSAIYYIRREPYRESDVEPIVDWLRHLKDRYTWKPSDEQMKALKEAVDEHFDIDGGALWHLYEDLKKLRKE